MPQHVAAIAQTHKIIVEQDAGLGDGLSNKEYIDSGATLVSSMQEVYAKANFIVKVKEPLPQEYTFIKKHHPYLPFFTLRLH